jgi:putative Mg2+ transporter-C (MgtC) family protein
VTGIGFLGAGTIIRQGLTVRGLTTAAALWIVAAIGMAVGAGFYLGAIVSTAVVLVALVGFRRLRPEILGRLRTDFVLVELEMTQDGDLGDAFAALGKRGARVQGMESDEEDGVYLFRLEVLAPPGTDLSAAVEEIRRMPGVNRVECRLTGPPRGLGPFGE